MTTKKEIKEKINKINNKKIECNECHKYYRVRHMAMIKGKYICIHCRRNISTTLGKGIKDFGELINEAILLSFNAGKQEAEKELSCTNCGKIMDKQFMSIECPECYLLGFRKQLDRELSEERKKIKEIFEKHFGEINSQQKNAPKNLEAMREIKCSRSELTESDNSVNGSERQTADTEPETKGRFAIASKSTSNKRDGSSGSSLNSKKEELFNLLQRISGNKYKRGQFRPKNTDKGEGK